jgi:hypothetical protein
MPRSPDEMRDSDGPTMEVIPDNREHGSVCEYCPETFRHGKQMLIKPEHLIYHTAETAQSQPSPAPRATTEDHETATRNPSVKETGSLAGS